MEPKFLTVVEAVKYLNDRYKRRTLQDWVKKYKKLPNAKFENNRWYIPTTDLDKYKEAV